MTHKLHMKSATKISRRVKALVRKEKILLKAIAQIERKKAIAESEVKRAG